ncbi:unnamed protein product [Penicillium camemberti]|uniref:Str. FM013 n=1 Tax=Penicillium camemberti (strain FM 013) TaxID=1429867 RepID=A0A0G4NU79_PENC3|nr:unnamed protein product [Penicillium camemberti]
MGFPDKPPGVVGSVPRYFSPPFIRPVQMTNGCG